MSKIVIKEGSLKFKSREKEISDVYLVLTSSHLKMYKSQNSYKQSPNGAIKVIDLSEPYLILPMSFGADLRFSIFKKGEKAADRFNLIALTQKDYDSWISFIENAIKDKSDSKSTDSTNSPKGPGETNLKYSNSVSRIQNSVTTNSSFENVELKSLKEKYSDLEDDYSKIRKSIQTIEKENEKLKTDASNLERELNKLKEGNEKLTVDKEHLQKVNSQIENKLFKANEELRKFKTEKQQLTDKKISLEKEISNLKSAKENNSLEQTKFNQIMTELCQKVYSSTIDLSSYMFCIDNLFDKLLSSSAIFEALLKKQLVNLIHKCPIGLDVNITILDYLTINVDLSQDCIIPFITRLLVSLCNYINKTTISKFDLDQNVISIIKSVVTMTKPSMKIDSQLSFHQTLFEIAYLLTKKINFKTQFTNDISENHPDDIHNQFNNFMRNHKMDITKKIVLVELGEQMKEIYQSKLADKENLLKSSSNNQSDQIIHSYLDKKWNNTLWKLNQKDQEISDLHITIHELSKRILTLEGGEDNPKSTQYFDEIINIYSMNADVLCSSCQSKAKDLLEMPVVKKINTLASDFRSYWETLLNVYTLLYSKQKLNSGLRDIFEKMTRSTQEFEDLMEQFSDITKRKIENPARSKSNHISNDNEITRN